jgi:hypothetical protein
MPTPINAGANPATVATTAMYDRHSEAAKHQATPLLTMPDVLAPRNAC